VLAVTKAGIDEASTLAGFSIAEKRIRSATGASVVGIIRDNQLFPNPDPVFAFKVGDQVAIIGEEQNRAVVAAMSRPAADVEPAQQPTP